MLKHSLQACFFLYSFVMRRCIPLRVCAHFRKLLGEQPDRSLANRKILMNFRLCVCMLFKKLSESMFSCLKLHLDIIGLNSSKCMQIFFYLLLTWDDNIKKQHSDSKVWINLVKVCFGAVQGDLRKKITLVALDNSSSSFWDISVWTWVLDWHTDRRYHP